MQIKSFLMTFPDVTSAAVWSSQVSGSLSLCLSYSFFFQKDLPTNSILSLSNITKRLLGNFVTIYLSTSVSRGWFSPRYCLLWRESTCPVLHFNEDGEDMTVQASMHACLKRMWCNTSAEMNSFHCLYLPVRTFLAVTFSSSWGHLCRSNHLQDWSAGTADQVSYSWKLLLTIETAAVIIWQHAAV